MNSDAPEGGEDLAAAFDLGSNMLRMVLGRRSNSGATRVLEKRVEVVRTAEGLAASGRLSEAALERVSGALVRLRREAERAGARAFHAVGTGALRLAANGAEARRRFEASLGAPIEIVSGEREAALALRGVRSQAEGLFALTLVDVGGTTTELLYLEGGACRAQSIELGVITLFERAQALAPERRDVEWRRVASEAVRALHSPERGLPVPCFALGGAAVALAALGRGVPYLEFAGDGLVALARETLDEAYRDFLARPLEEGARRLGISPPHAALVQPGYWILTSVLDHLGIPSVVPSGRGVAEGLLDERLEPRPGSRPG